jgi:hypothetical protein
MKFKNKQSQYVLFRDAYMFINTKKRKDIITTKLELMATSQDGV